LRSKHLEDTVRPKEYQDVCTVSLRDVIAAEYLFSSNTWFDFIVPTFRGFHDRANGLLNADADPVLPSPHPGGRHA